VLAWSLRGSAHPHRRKELGEAAGITRLIPPSDPLLQPRDRGVLTTERDQQRALWPTLRSPGTPAAEWPVPGRTRLAGRTLTLTATPWRTLGPVERAALAQEAQLVGSMRGAARTSQVIS
jgi:hypothetical protein